MRRSHYGSRTDVGHDVCCSVQLGLVLFKMKTFKTKIRHNSQELGVQLYLGLILNSPDNAQE